MDTVIEKIGDWLKEVIISFIMNQLTGLFDSINMQVGSVAEQVGKTPQDFSPGVFSMIQNISETVVLPIAGIFLTFIACYELIQMITEHNNLANFETWIFFKWVFKTFAAVLLISNTFDIVMGVFELAQYAVNQASSVISGETDIDGEELSNIEEKLNEMEIGPLLGLLVQVILVSLGVKILSLVIFVIVYGRMIEIYLMTSLAPVPFSTFSNREQSQIGQNYLKSLLALGFQAFLILICVGIYAVLIHDLTVSDDVVASMWSCMGYMVLLTFTLFKTGSLAKSIFGAH